MRPSSDLRWWEKAIVILGLWVATYIVASTCRAIIDGSDALKRIADKLETPK